MNRILIIDDDVHFGKLLKQLLSLSNYNVEVVDSVESALEVLHDSFDLYVLEILISEGRGLCLAQELKNHHDRPIIILTKSSDELLEIVALNTVADDYINKPVQPHRFLARVSAQLRKNLNKCFEKECEIFIDSESRCVYCKGEIVDFTNSEFEILLFMYRNANVALSRDVLISKFRGIDYDGVDRSLDVRISMLRKKLGDTRPPYRIIKTIRNIGYLFNKEVVSNQNF